MSLSGDEHKTILFSVQSHPDLIELNESISLIARMLIKQYAQNHALALGDALIAATSLYSNLELVTANYRDFRFIDGLELKKFTPSR